MKNDEVKLGADEMLNGAVPIAAYLSEVMGKPVTTKNVYYWFRKGYVPGGKFAGSITSTKTQIRERLAQMIGA